MFYYQDSLSSVESLIRKHDDFGKSLLAQEEKLGHLKDHATKLLAEDHYDTPAIITRRFIEQYKYIHGV